MDTERSAGDRVEFEHGYAARIMGSDGTWQREVLLEEVSDTEAKLTAFGAVGDLCGHRRMLVRRQDRYAELSKRLFARPRQIQLPASLVSPGRSSHYIH